MAPMTRSRAIANIPNELMAEYYAQRNGAGLIITEGTAPAPEALGYPRIPGMFSQEQIDGWKLTTSEVHEGSSKVFLQLMHTGRIGHVDNLPAGTQLVGASAIKAAGQIFTDAKGLQDYSQPVALTTAGVKDVIAGYVSSAKNAIKAGFDGVELHAANGYLIEQFLNPNVNTRLDEYGGSIKARAKMALDLASQTADAIGEDKVGIRFSPYSELGDLKSYADDEIFETYIHLTRELNQIGIAYIHIGLSPKIPQKLLSEVRAAFNGAVIICNGLTPTTAEEALNGDFADLVAFGRAWLANPDLERRIETNSTLQTPDFSTLYTPGSKGYTDYPVLGK